MGVEISMKNTLKPLPSFSSDTPRTDEVRHNTAELAMHARKLERELADLKAIHKTAIIDCQQYTPESWKEICDIQEPAAVWIEGKQMTDLMKDKERISWLLTTQSFMAMHLLGTCKDIDEAMEVNQ